MQGGTGRVEGRSEGGSRGRAPRSVRGSVALDLAATGYDQTWRAYLSAGAVHARCLAGVPSALVSADEPAQQDSEYEIERKRRIEENMAMMKELGLGLL